MTALFSDSLLDDYFGSGEEKRGSSKLHRWGWCFPDRTNRPKHGTLLPKEKWSWAEPCLATSFPRPVCSRHHRLSGQVVGASVEMAGS